MAKKTKPNLAALTADEIAVRDQQTSYMKMFNMLPDPDPILAQKGKGIEVYRDLTTDAHVWANRQQRKTAVTSLLWEIKQNNSDQRKFSLISELFNSLDINQIIEQILNAPLYGHSILEVNWSLKSGLVLPYSVQEKPQEYFHFSPTNQLMLKTKSVSQGIPIPDYKFLLVTQGATYLNPYGEKALARCFWPVTFKRGGLRFWITFTEKFGMPYIIGKQPSGAGNEAATELLSKLELMVQDAIAVIPDNGSVEIQWPQSGAAVEAYRHFLEFMNSEISKALLSQTLTTELQNSGSYSASQTHASMLTNITDGDRKLVEKALNQLIHWIYTINFGNENNTPSFHLYEPEDVDTITADRDEKLVKQGIRFTADYYKKTYNLTDQDFTLSAESPVSPESFKSFSSSDPAQEALPAKILQMQIEQTLKPIFKLIEKGSTFEEIEEGLKSIYPEMKSSQLENLLTKVLFISELNGRLSDE
jgi:phage gp29-like protein